MKILTQQKTPSGYEVALIEAAPYRHDVQAIRDGVVYESHKNITHYVDALQIYVQCLNFYRNEQ